MTPLLVRALRVERVPGRTLMSLARTSELAVGYAN
jgi:hypothetical protein